MTAGIYAAQTALISAMAAFYGGEAARLTGAMATACARCQEFLTELANITPVNDGNYNLRDTALKTCQESYLAVSQYQLQERLGALEYQGVAIDLELVRFYLFGREVIASSKL